MLSGILLGWAFDFRFQVAFAILGLGAWAVIFKKLNFKSLLFMLLGFSVSVLIAFGIDYWFYGTAIFMPYKYFYVQIVENVASNWEVYPWWYYIVIFTEQVFPPLSVVLLVAFFLSVWINYRTVYVWVVIAFLAGHSLVAHKEARFLLPVFPMFIITAFLVFNHAKIYRFWFNAKNKALMKMLISLIVIENSLLLAAATFKPANEVVGLFQVLHNLDAEKKNIVLYESQHPYKWGELWYHFYRNRNIEVALYEPEIAEEFLNKPNTNVYLASPKFNAESTLTGIKLASVYKTIPTWMEYFNFNNWLSRARVWSLYKVEQADLQL